MAGPQSALAPHGPAARVILDLTWVLLALSVFVVVLVIGVLAYALRRRRHFTGVTPPLPLGPEAAGETRQSGAASPHAGQVRASGDGEPPKVGAFDDDPAEVAFDTREADRRSLRWVLAGGVAFPLAVLIPLFIYTLLTLGVLAARPPASDLVVAVTGWQFWWEVRYLDADGSTVVETANEIHIPVGRRVEIRLDAADVIHSFWVPNLHGKLDLVPGRTTQFWIEADRAGTYRGQCAEYCGVQHANMSFLVIASPEPEFREWLIRQAAPAREPTDSLAAAGLEVFLGRACAACHAIRGTRASGAIAPDLTHLASRRTLAALTLPNTRGHLGGWIANPQAIKPGNRMPAVPLAEGELHALLHYLESLQ